MPKAVFKTTSKKGTAQYTVEVKTGDVILREGDLGTEMYVIHQGKVEIRKQVGEETKVLAVLEKGDFFGEMSLLEDLPRAASAHALTDGRLVQIDGTTFTHLLTSNPEIAVRMMRKLSRRLRETDRLLKEALGTPVPPPSEPPAPSETAGAHRLIQEKSGMEFPLAAGTEATVGRRDPVTGIHPDVDLTPVDVQRSTSRRHAKIYRRADKLFVSEEIGTMNGTFVNGVRLETGVPAEVHPGDRIRFGLVDLVLHTAP